MAKTRNLKVEQPGELLVFLQSAYKDQKRTTLKQYLKHRCVSVNDQVVTRHDHPVAAGDTVRVTIDKTARPAAPMPAGIRVVYEDELILVIHKPVGLLSVPNPGNPVGSALNAASDYLSSVPGQRGRRAHVVHRLDKHTSGLLLFAKSASARAFFLDNWTRVEKKYLAIVDGIPSPRQGTLKSVLKEDPDMKVRPAKPDEEGEEAETRYRVLKTSEQFALVECSLVTGRKNQIRVQLSEIGHPILGDHKYGSKKNPCGRLALHAWRMKIPHPATGEIIKVESPLPDTLARILAPDK